MTDNCLNELFVRNTVIPVGMKPDPTAAGGVIALSLALGRSRLQDSGSEYKERLRVPHFSLNTKVIRLPLQVNYVHIHREARLSG